MRIALVSGDDVVGDDPRQLCAALTNRGEEVTAYVRQPGRRPAVEAGSSTVSLRVGPHGVASPAELLPYVGGWAAALERLWSSDRPDLVHAYGWLGGLAAQLAARRHRLPIVQSFQGMAATSRLTSNGAPGRDSERERIEPLLARGATWVTGECAADVDVLARLCRGRARVSSLCSGVDVERYSPVGTAAARSALHRILCLAPNPLPHNGFDVAIRALPTVHGAELVLIETAPGLAGHDEARARLADLAGELGVADRVRLPGVVGADELPALLRSADAVACTPRRPPRATTALQAMASGVAVVALPVGVLTDVVVDAVTGVLVPRNSPAAVGAALRSLLAQTFQCGSLGAAGRSRAVSRFTWDRIALDALSVYRQVGSHDRVSAQMQSTGAR